MKLQELITQYHSGLIDKASFIERMFEHHCTLLSYSEIMHSTDIERIVIQNHCAYAVIRSSGIQLICDAIDMRQATYEILNFGAYEPFFARIMLDLVSPHAQVFDVGANIGYYSLTLAKANPKATIWAFEPIPETFQRLCKNLQCNALPNIRAFDLGLYDRQGELNFFLEPILSVRASAVDLSPSQNARKVVCKVNTLDAFAKENAVAPDLVKCDCEGSELFVLKGAAETLRRHQPIVFSEMLRKWSARFGYHPNEIISFLGALDYQCFEIGNDRLNRIMQVTESTLVTNYLFLHVGKHTDLIDRYSWPISI